MDQQIYLILANKLNQVCNCKDDNLVYSLTPSLDNKPDYIKLLYAHNLDKFPLILDAALEVFGNKRTGVAKKSYPYARLKEEKDNFISILATSKELLGVETLKIGNDKIGAALAALSHIYLDSFIYPIQFFLPHSSVCSGHWDFWDKINYMELIKKIHQKETVRLLSEKLLKSGVWKTKFYPDDFPEIVKRRLLKEGLLGKKLDRNAMMKAIIIRMGELAKPSINYEIIDFSIRSFFTYLGVKHYLRVDREILFLRALEGEIKGILRDI